MILAGPAVPTGSLVLSSITCPRMSTPFNQPPTSVARPRRRSESREASRYGWKRRVKIERLTNVEAGVEQPTQAFA
jgi:hypothetical protein